MKKIEITSKTFGVHHILVDDEDYDRINKYKWTLKKSNQTFYARRSCSNPTWILLHREVLQLNDKNIQIDHKDGNGLNNQKSNLRSCTNSQNGANKASLKGSSSKFKGVCLRPKRKNQKYQAAIQINGKVKFLGMYSDEEQAARAYDKAAKEYHKEFAKLNFPCE